MTPPAHPLSFDAYQAAAHDTAIYPGSDRRMSADGLFYLVAGLSAEVGELAGKIAKVHRDLHLAFGADDVVAIDKELGDCLWFIAELCDQFALSMGQTAERNLAKLASRAQRGVIGGSGDDR